MAKPKLYEQGLEEYPRSSTIIGNIAMAAWIALGTIGCWFLSPVGAWIFLAFAVIMVGVALRKLVCTNCYYYDRWCSIGWGKLSALMFPKGDEDKFSTSLGQKIAPITYGILTVIPIVFLVTSMFDSSRLLIPKIIVLVLLLAVSFYSGTSGRKKGCSNCKMRLVCGGSAVKESE
ncbi:MAG TPA: hypothetical protein G4O12_00585 [Dehalococcoidia bacterium]|nr:hypothetical protein [Dehalococcoidia bacterium]